MLSDALSSLLLAGWHSILLCRCTLNASVHPSGRSVADKAGGNGDFADNWNAAAPSCRKFDQDALMICSVSEMYLWLSFACFGREIPFVWHIGFGCPATSPKSHGPWPFCSIFFPPHLSSIPIHSASAWYEMLRNRPRNILLFTWANCLMKTFSSRVLPLVLDCLQLRTSRGRSKLASNLTPCGMIEIMLCAVLERSAYFGCVSAYWCHQLMISGNKNEQMISLGSEW